MQIRENLKFESLVRKKVSMILWIVLIWFIGCNLIEMACLISFSIEQTGFRYEQSQFGNDSNIFEWFVHALPFFLFVSDENNLHYYKGLEYLSAFCILLDTLSYFTFIQSFHRNLNFLNQQSLSSISDTYFLTF